MTSKLQAAQQMRDSAQAQLNTTMIQLWEALYTLDQATKWVASLQTGNGTQPIDKVVSEPAIIGVNTLAERALLDFRNNRTAYDAARAQIRSDQLAVINAAS